MKREPSDREKCSKPAVHTQNGVANWIMCIATEGWWTLVAEPWW